MIVNFIYKTKGLARAACSFLLSAFFVVSLQFSVMTPSPALAAHAGAGSLDDPAQVLFLDQMLRENYVEALQYMTTQFTAVMLFQMEIVGTLIDAKHQLESQLIFQEIAARAHKEFHPSVEMCIVGTNIRHLAASERKAKVNARLLNKMMLDRETLASHTISANGPVSDLRSRYLQFASTYCDVDDANGEWDDFGGITPMEGICNQAPTFPPPQRPSRWNNDLDFTRMVDTRLTLDIDWTNIGTTDDETDIIALTRNLFSHTVFNRVAPMEILQEFASDDMQDMRSIVAMRGVIRNSWGHIIGMRAQGSPVAAPLQFLHSLYRQMGVGAVPAWSDADVIEYIGQNPSYFAQMEFLTKKMYQNPDFYTNLYTKPVNVARTGVAMQALQLMHNRDRYEAQLRKEMLISMLLEAQLRDLSEALNDQIMNTIAIEFVEDIANP